MSPSDPPKRGKSMFGVEFSGLERPTDFLILVVFAVAFIVIALLIAWLAFG